MRNTLEKRFALKCLTPCVMACVAILVGSSLTTHAATKKLRVPPSTDGRSIHPKAATFTFTIPKDIIQFKGILIEARGNFRGQHAILLDTYVSHRFQNTKTQVTQEYLEFNTNRDEQRIRLNLSDASIQQSSWMPDKTTISFLVQGDEEGLSEINDLIFYYVAQDEGDPVDPKLIETPNLKPKGVYSGLPVAPEPFFPEDLDDEESPIVLKPNTPVKGKLLHGRPENLKPERMVRIPTRKRPSLKIKEPNSDRDEDNLRGTPQNTPLRRPGKWTDQ